MKLLSLCVVSTFVIGCAGSSPTAPSPSTPALPIISGQWSGTYSIGRCTETSPGFCAAVGAGGGLVLTPNQSGGNLTGTLSIGAFNIPITGSVNSDAVVVLAGSGPVQAGATLTLISWRTVATGNTMSGSMAFNVTLAPDTVTVTATANLAKQ